MADPVPTSRRIEDLVDEILPGAAPGPSIVTDDALAATSEFQDPQVTNSSFEEGQFHEALGSVPEPHESILEVYCLFTLSDVKENDAWDYLKLGVSVTQNYVKDPLDASPQPNNCAQVMQQKHENGGGGGRHMIEIIVRIVINNTPETSYRHYKFQLFGTVAEDSATREVTNCLWSNIEACVFITFPSGSQTLRPIARNILRRTAILRFGDSFLGSFAFDGTELYHVDPSEEVLRQRDHANASAVTPQLIDAGDDKVIIVKRADIVDEPRRARGGRPRHRCTSQYLMTTPQVEKVIEIRQRWQGLKDRQRKANVSEEDLYCFFTLNRDETAEALNVCATWLKDVLREQGIVQWPQRPLRKSGTDLEDLKQTLESDEAALRYTGSDSSRKLQISARIEETRRKIAEKMKERRDIVQANVKEEYFQHYLEKEGDKFLNPEWNALPPPPHHHRGSEYVP